MESLCARSDYCGGWMMQVCRMPEVVSGFDVAAVQELGVQHSREPIAKICTKVH